MSARSFDITKHNRKQSNIRVLNDHGFISILLHGHCVVTIEDNHRVTLHSCGYKTVTTKTAINRALSQLNCPVNLSQKKGIWYIGQEIFFDGYKIDLKEGCLK
jgi:hypothetical protein